MERGHSIHEAEADLLAAAADVVRSEQERLQELLARARRTHTDLGNRLHQVERGMREVAEGIDQAKMPRAGQSPSEQALTLSALHEQYDALRHQQARLTERLNRLQTEMRKLRAVIKQTAMSAQYLAGTMGDADGDLLSLTQIRALEAQEEERRRLAREIHDGPAQVLTNAIFQLEYNQRLVEKDPRKVAAELDRLKGDLREGLADVRYFIFNLRPGPLAELGLAATLQRYAESYQSRFGIGVLLDLDFNMERLSGTQEVAIFRIIQEALQNARKHSAASQVSVTLRTGPDGVYAAVADNGVGFEIGRYEDGSLRHFGLASMQERARLIRADLRITSAPGAGTHVELRVPPEQVATEV